jgi:hypothetical protein
MPRHSKPPKIKSVTSPLQFVEPDLPSYAFEVYRADVDKHTQFHYLDSALHYAYTFYGVVKDINGTVVMDYSYRRPPTQ